ncbi:dTDP-4-dehydrorhamnose 3,5-epimerase family protein [Polynucleobacter sp. JS-Fieb-80-E5]|uniref:dTDP-4-dehydrorhamnose 3,5-epimerase family protein n=1 Tax=Polynucleobacter sp. JS-Fieb-80-E5 TaxID=2081050 RepID=UPI001C0D67E6|nr:dTDP-4-dehydrorhamnose 3,5-epimerase family protein [Polynucleobacter sp. JS-Fieb-80-E5]MBU3619960.1 dTDP-4-dehydrorhamnose 3,5-epimerase family protein [Polynucleobacter sp. JS-Fieb-80-E5]
MNVMDTILEGVKVIEVIPLRDERGEFARIFCDDELQGVLKGKTIKQINRSMTRKIGAVRGMHFQNAPYAEIKIVRCLKGRVFDVAVDLRKDSATFLKWFGIELSPLKNIALVIPEGCAHGFQVLEKDSELLYLHTAPYTPSSEAAIRFDEPLIHISWPITPTDLSQRDLSHPYLNKVFKGISI